VIWSNAHYARRSTCFGFRADRSGDSLLAHVRINGPTRGHRSIALHRVLLVLDTGINTARGICDPLLCPAKATQAALPSYQNSSTRPASTLVMVRYEEDNHNIHDEWVYNGAEIDNAKVLWGPRARPATKRHALRLFQRTAKSG